MMKIIFVLIIYFFIINGVYKFILQIYYQNLIFILFFYFFMNFSLNNLNFWMKLYYIYGVDFYSWGLILLSLWILSLMIMVSLKIFYLKFYYMYMILMNFMLILLIMCFSSLNLILFYLFFESSLIPIFLLILGWGGHIERIQSGFYMMLYTLFGSMPLFLIIMNLYLMEDSLMMNMILVKKLNFFVYLGLIGGFLIKMPMYFVHLWLPKAHVEAPVMGSMMLAGVMLKLGGYGLMRVLVLMINLSLKFNKFFLVISLMGGVYSSLICLYQVDMKMLVAYSSVVHMSVLMSSLMTLSSWGFIGAYLMMIAHGLCSSGLFYLVNVSYERSNSRSLYLNKGLINYFPSLSLMWFFLCSSNLSFPPSLNLFSEIMMFNSLIMWCKYLILILFILLFFSASYSLYFYSFTQHGKINLLNYMYKSVLVNEYYILMLHWVPLNLLFLMMMIFI